MDFGTSWIFICQYSQTFRLIKTFRTYMESRSSVLLKNYLYKAIITNVTVWIKQREERGRNLRSQRHSRPKGLLVVHNMCSRLVSSKPQNNTQSTVINSRGGIYKKKNKKVRKQENTLSTKKTIKKKEEKKRENALSTKRAIKKKKKNDNGQEK